MTTATTRWTMMRGSIVIVELLGAGSVYGDLCWIGCAPTGFDPLYLWR